MQAWNFRIRSQICYHLLEIGANSDRYESSEFIVRQVSCKRIKRNVWRPIRPHTGLSSSRSHVNTPPPPPPSLEKELHTWNTWCILVSQPEIETLRRKRIGHPTSLSLVLKLSWVLFLISCCKTSYLEKFIAEHFKCTSYLFISSYTGTHEPNNLTCSQLHGFVAQLVDWIVSASQRSGVYKETIA